ARTVHFAGMTTTSALVSLQTHFLLRPGEPAVEQLFRLIEEQDPRDEAGGGIHAVAARVLRGDLDAWEWLHSIVQRPRMPLSKLSRMADCVAYLEANDRIARVDDQTVRSEEHTSELQSRFDLVCRLLLEKKKRMLVQRAW